MNNLFSSKDAMRLANLSRLGLSEKELERMTAELERAIDRAKTVFENQGAEPKGESIEVAMLRKDKIEPFENPQCLRDNGQTENNLFVSKRVV